MSGLSAEDREALGGPDGPWIKDDWDGLLDTVERIVAAAAVGTIALGPGDESDLEAGRCCPRCRHIITEHNVAVWNAGYAVGTRHERETR